MLLEYTLKMSRTALRLKAMASIRSYLSLNPLHNRTSPIFLQQSLFSSTCDGFPSCSSYLNNIFSPSTLTRASQYLIHHYFWVLFCTFVTCSGGLLLVILPYFWIKNEICFKSWHEWSSGQTQVGSPIGSIDRINHSCPRLTLKLTLSAFCCHASASVHARQLKAAHIQKKTLPFPPRASWADAHVTQREVDVFIKFLHFLRACDLFLSDASLDSCCAVAT